MTQFSNEKRNRDHSDRRPADWQRKDRRLIWPWVMDINDRRSGLDRRLEERRNRENRALL